MQRRHHEDINADELKTECFHLNQYLKNIAKQSADLNISTLHNLIKSDKLEETFSNVEFATKIFLCLMVTNCSGERSFSQLKRIKNGYNLNSHQNIFLLPKMDKWLPNYVIHLFRS